MQRMTTPPSPPTAAPLSILYGIPNCDTVKKARAWLAERGTAYLFHDFKKHGLPEAVLDHWLTELGWEKLLNRQGTTWRRLDEATRARITDRDSARTLLLAQPSLIKRPVVQWSSPQTRHTLTVGFDAATWSRLAPPATPGADT